MNIGIVIGRIGGIDGVALETEKWIEVFERMGHNCLLLTGEVEGKIKNATLLPDLSFFHENCTIEQDMAFFNQDVDENKVANFIETNSSYIESQIIKWISDKNIDLLLAENSSTIPCHLSMGIALKYVFEKTGIKGLIHNHDFYWERGSRYKSKYKFINEKMEECFPPVLENVKHVVINSHGKEILKSHKGIDSLVIPNVMDFEKSFAQKDEYNSDLLSELGIEEADIPIFQVTRIVRRKGIETAIQLISSLKDKKYKLVITGSAKDDEKLEYFYELKTLIDQYNLRDQVIFAENRFNNYRYINENGEKVYSLEDAYAYAEAMTYFSTYEGFGNAFVEAILAKVPVFVNNYKPVYWPDIGSKGFKTVQIEDGILTSKAVSDIGNFLSDKNLSQDIADFNYTIGKKHYSFEVLESLLSELL